MRLPAPLVIIPALLLCTAGFCQRANSQIKSPEKKPAATISGKVTIKGKPAPGVIVGVRLSQPRQFDPTFKATTDQDGKYRIDEVPAGSYEVAPVAPAYVSSEVDNSRGQTVLITEGEHVEGIDFQMVRGGVITGKVTGADGLPIVQESVNLMPLEPGGPVYPVWQNFQTDDRGIYRIFGIRPGRYKVSVGQGGINSVGRFGAGRPVYRMTFHPDATDPAKATVVEIADGTEATRIDITVGPTEQRFSASGRIVDGETGKPVANAGIGLSRIVIRENSSSSSGGGPDLRSDSEGEFRLENLPPGKYEISIYLPSESDLRVEPLRFDLVDQDVTGLLIKTSMGGASLSGLIVLEGARNGNVPAALAQSSIGAYSRNEALNTHSGRSARIRPDGSFRIGGLLAGTANFSLNTAYDVKGFTISRIERDGVVQPSGIQIQNGEQVTGLRVFVAYSNGSIRGVVKLENGTLPSSGRLFIQLIKPGDQSWNGPQVGADARGHFLIEGLSAGSYELTVMAFVPGSQQRTPSAKQVVIVADGAATEVTVIIDLAPTPDPEPFL